LMKKSWMKPIILWVLFVAVAVGVQTAASAPVITDLQGLIDAQLATNNIVTIAPGRYYVAPSGRIHLRFENLNDVTIVADDVEMVCTETTQAIFIGNCTNLTIQGLTIDYDPLNFTQGVIESMANNNTEHTVRLLNGYPDSGTISGDKYEIFDPTSLTLRCSTYYGAVITSQSPSNIVVAVASDKGAQVGDIIILDSRDAPGGRIPHAVRITHSEGLVLQDVTLYGSPTFGFLETDCSDTHYLRCTIDRRPAETDLKTREFPRMRSLNADGYHSKHADIGPTIENCSAKFNGDDSVAINGHYHMVMACNNQTLRVLAKQGDMNIEPGDPVELWEYTGLRLDDANVQQVDFVGSATSEELTFLSNQSMLAEYKDGSALNQAYEITIDRAIDMPMGSLIGSANRMGNGFKVIGGTFGFNRSRGILVKASNGLVQSNVVEGCWGAAIKSAPEFWWLESGCSWNLTVSDNMIQNCLSEGIVFEAKPGAGGVAPVGAHGNIVIENNIITNTSGTHIFVASTRGLTLSGNTFDEEKFELVNCADVQGGPVVGLLVADYNNDYSASIPLAAGWRYLWNAPVGWEAGVSAGDLSSGAIGYPDNYVALLDAGSSWTPDGDTSGTNNSPGSYLKLTSGNGHPGNGYASGPNQDRYAIAAFTVPSNGVYAIENSTLNKTSTNGDGVEVLVFADDASNPVIQRVAEPASTTHFNVQIGYLEAGQSIYVAFGAVDSASADFFEMDYSIFLYPATFDDRVMARNPAYVAWKNQHNLKKGADGNDDADTLSNFAEFALGGDPTNSANTGYASTLHAAAGGFEYVHVRRKGTSLDYSLELTDDLVSGVWTNSGYSVLSTSTLDADFDVVTNQIPDLGKTNQFIRLMIEQL
jgi:hypothetical protein